jgi:alkanesulfonate monooxygenase SsuD/methylene tetrahydromethanopterin reductase-like flavin-dependent oxidoreductase (luciferase family)
LSDAPGPQATTVPASNTPSRTSGSPDRPSASQRVDWGLDGPTLGISISGAIGGVDWGRNLEWVDQAEALGLHSVWVPEMHFTPTGNAAPLLSLAAVAARTKRIRVATTSVLLPIHHPVRLAAEVVALDHLSNGRLILGLGRGFSKPLFEGFGIDPTEKRDRFDESLDIMLAIFRGETPRTAGGPFEVGPLAPLGAGERPLQRPHPPLAVAAFGPKGLRQAARRGLPYLASPMEPFDLIAENHVRHRADLPAELEAGSLPVAVMRTVFVARDRSEADRALSALAQEQRLPPGRKLPSVLARAAAAPVEDRVVIGEVEEVTERLARYRDEIGLDLLIVRPQVAGIDHAARRRSLDDLVGRVLPALRTSA